MDAVRLAFRSYWRAHMGASSKRSRKKKGEIALMQAYHELSTQASETKQAQGRQSFGSVKENREKLVGLEAALRESN